MVKMEAYYFNNANLDLILAHTLEKTTMSDTEASQLEEMLTKSSESVGSKGNKKNKNKAPHIPVPVVLGLGKKKSLSSSSDKSDHSDSGKQDNTDKKQNGKKAASKKNANEVMGNRLGGLKRKRDELLLQKKTIETNIEKLDAEITCTEKKMNAQKVLDEIAVQKQEHISQTAPKKKPVPPSPKRKRNSPEEDKSPLSKKQKK